MSELRDLTAILEGLTLHRDAHDFIAEDASRKSGMKVSGDIGRWDVADGSARQRPGCPERRRLRMADLGPPPRRVRRPSPGGRPDLEHGSKRLSPKVRSPSRVSARQDAVSGQQATLVLMLAALPTLVGDRADHSP